MEKTERDLLLVDVRHEWAKVCQFDDGDLALPKGAEALQSLVVKAADWQKKRIIEHIQVRIEELQQENNKDRASWRTGLVPSREAMIQVLTGLVRKLQ